METYRRIEGLVDYIAARYKRAAEIGIGHFPDVASALSGRGVRVIATDILPFSYKGIKVFIDDIMMPDLSLFQGTDLVYSMRPPPELVPYMIKLASAIPADLIVKPLSSECIAGCRTIRNGDALFLKWDAGSC